ncbi:MAG: cytochrome c biogenesis protein ResB [Chloroflexi bacterium]|nr:MAG: cytochrome c biogenesis protein ResB [Chloroflexota bacterium]
MSSAAELVPAGPAANAVSEVAQLPPLTEEQSHFVVEKVWRFFCSLRLTLANLLLLFVAMIAGTFVNPQNDSLVNIERAFAGRPWVLGAYRWFELYDLFHSWWFTLHVVGLRFKVPAAASELSADAVADTLRKRRYRVQMQDGFVFAERGRYARFGVWVVHLSLLLILGGGVFGRLTAFEGTAQVPQNGGIISGFVQRNPDGTEFKHRLLDAGTGRPFLVQCNDFRLKEFEPGRPKAFESDLVAYEDLGSREPGRELARATITVNHPLRYGGLTFYQASYAQLEDGQRAKIVLRDRASRTTREMMVSADEAIGAAEGLTYRLVEYSQDFAGLGPAVQVVSFSFERLAPLYATGLQIARDPSTPVVYAGCFLLFAGIGIAFYTSHKRIWAQVAAGKVALGGASHRNAEAFGREFAQLRQDLSL